MTQVWENKGEAARSWSSERPLTHLVDLTDRQDEMKVTRACSVEACGRPHKARGWCGFHYDRWSAGLPLETPARGYGQTRCAAADCDRKHRSGGFCQLHYRRFKKHGSAMLTGPAAPRWQGPARACAHEGCDRPQRANGWCGMHNLRHQNGQDMSAPPKGAVIGYVAAHQRITARYGRAVERSCVDCGTTADQWSYTYGDPNEQYDSRGYAYSADPAWYVARCYSCHRIFDMLHAGDLAAGHVAKRHGRGDWRCTCGISLSSGPRGTGRDGAWDVLKSHKQELRQGAFQRIPRRNS